MIPFSLEFSAGVPISEQVVYSVRKAIIMGALRPGDKFPSIRVLSQELRINPNTAHKIIAHLTGIGLLEVHPGIGTVISKLPPATLEQRREVLGKKIEHLVVEARQLQLTIEEVNEALRDHWKRLS